MDILKAEISLYKLRNEKDMSIDALAVLTSNILKSRPYYVQTILAGVDKDGAKLYTLDPSGSYIPDTFTSTGSGSPYAFGVLEDRYNEDITTEEGKKIAINSGNNYRLGVITKDGMKIYTKEEIAQIKKQL